jgi:hypothetical protein
MILECMTCNDQVDVEARTVVLPFECKWCVEGWVPTPEGFEPDATKFIVQTKGVGGWFRSLNPGLFQFFYTRDAALEAIAKETDGFERRVVDDGTPDDIDTNEYNVSSSNLQSFSATRKSEEQNDCDQEYIFDGKSFGYSWRTSAEPPTEPVPTETEPVLTIEKIYDHLFYNASDSEIRGLVKKLTSLEGLKKEYEFNSIGNETNAGLRQELNAALEFNSRQELVLNEKSNDIRVYRSLLGLSRG